MSYLVYNAAGTIVRVRVGDGANAYMGELMGAADLSITGGEASSTDVTAYAGTVSIPGTRSSQTISLTMNSLIPLVDVWDWLRENVDKELQFELEIPGSVIIDSVGSATLGIPMGTPVGYRTRTATFSTTTGAFERGFLDPRIFPGHAILSGDDMFIINGKNATNKAVATVNDRYVADRTVAVTAASGAKIVKPTLKLPFSGIVSSLPGSFNLPAGGVLNAAMSIIPSSDTAAFAPSKPPGA